MVTLELEGGSGCTQDNTILRPAVNRRARPLALKWSRVGYDVVFLESLPMTFGQRSQGRQEPN